MKMPTPENGLNLLDIKFLDFEYDMMDMQAWFNKIGSDAIYLTHEELAQETDLSISGWKKFLTDPRVRSAINEELTLLKHNKTAKMLRTIDSNKNTAAAQTLNMLLKSTESTGRKEGPVFIYTQIPLNENEKHAEGVVNVDESHSTSNRNR